MVLASLLLAGPVTGMLLLAAGAAAASPGDRLTDALRASDPAIAALIDANPGMADGWREPFWADALLKAPPIAGTPWRVHDLARPQPPVVRPSSAPCPRPPRGAVRLFDDGGDLSAWTGPDAALWEVREGTLLPSGRKANRLHTRQAFADVELGLEFRMPDPPIGVFQQRGNSGLFFQQRYEVQILDSHRNPTYPDGQMGALYGQVPPAANASRPPGQWQCLRVVYRTPRFAADGALLAPARATVTLNGVRLQDNSAFLGPTAFAAILPYTPHPGALPIALQDHGDPGGRIAFRRIWARPLEGER